MAAPPISYLREAKVGWIGLAGGSIDLLPERGYGGLGWLAAPPSPT